MLCSVFGCTSSDNPPLLKRPRGEGSLKRRLNNLRLISARQNALQTKRCDQVRRDADRKDNSCLLRRGYSQDLLRLVNMYTHNDKLTGLRGAGKLFPLGWGRRAEPAAALSLSIS